jgi:hypothetical protein
LTISSTSLANATIEPIIRITKVAVSIFITSYFLSFTDSIIAAPGMNKEKLDKGKLAER